VEQLRRLCPAKVNLYLKVTGRREDGYHELVTVMQPLSLADILTVTRKAEGLSLTCDHPHLPSGPENLVWRAARAFAEALGQPVDVHLNLEKRIPLAAGLGGGSSDAAGTLLALNRLYREPLPAATLHRLAAGLGADAPFFLSPAPQIGRGIGTELTPIRLPPYWYVLVNPGFPVSTGEVYRGLELEALARRTPPLPQDFAGRPPRAWVGNDLETVTLNLFPELNHLLSALADAGAEARGMSGSGPTLFGLFSGAPEALRAARRLREHYSGWLAVARGLTGEAGEADWGDLAWII